MFMGIGNRCLHLSALLVTGSLLLTTLPLRADPALLKKADKQITVKKFKSAIRSLTKAMNAGDLNDHQMAQALYKRGVAQNGSKRHSAAIADLTGAIWLGKLDAASQKNAYRQRAIAYESTGHKKQARKDLAKSGHQAVAAIKTPSKKPTIAQAYPPIPTFNTVVRSEKNKASSTSAQATVAAKPVVEKKAVIPAFRTTIAAE